MGRIRKAPVENRRKGDKKRKKSKKIGGEKIIEERGN